MADKRLCLPGVVSEFAWLVDKVQTLGLYNQKIHVLSEMNKTIACSVQKAERELGYRPAIELEEGMAEACSGSMAPNQFRAVHRNNEARLRANAS